MRGRKRKTERRRGRKRGRGRVRFGKEYEDERKLVGSRKLKGGDLRMDAKRLKEKEREKDVHMYISGDGRENKRRTE